IGNALSMHVVLLSLRNGPLAQEVLPQPAHSLHIARPTLSSNYSSAGASPALTCAGLAAGLVGRGEQWQQLKPGRRSSGRGGTLTLRGSPPFFWERLLSWSS